MTEEMRIVIREEIHSGIKEAVNGKIDAIRSDLNIHAASDKAFQDRIEPYLQGAAGLGIIWKVLIAFGLTATAYMAVKNVTHLLP